MATINRSDREIRQQPVGTIAEVHGPVVLIDCSRLPPLRQALFAVFAHTRYLSEVHQHIDERHVRAITLHGTAGLYRGMQIYDSGAPLHVPVSRQCLGRLLNIFGEPLDGLPPLTYAEYLRDTLHKGVLFVMDNVFRFVQAGSEISSLLGRMPATVGYQPTLTTEVAELEDRILSTKQGAITSVQAVYVPADDMSDPAVSAILSHLDTTVILSRAQASKGIYPAVDPLRSGSKLMDKYTLGEHHYVIAEGVREHLARYHELRTSSPCSASRNCRKRTAGW